jgi:hypothetical protein
LKGELTMDFSPAELESEFDRGIPFAGSASRGTVYRAIFIDGAWDVICHVPGGMPFSHLQYRLQVGAKASQEAFKQLRRKLRADGWPHLREQRPRYRTRRRTATA